MMEYSFVVFVIGEREGVEKRYWGTCADLLWEDRMQEGGREEVGSGGDDGV